MVPDTVPTRSALPPVTEHPEAGENKPGRVTAPPVVTRPVKVPELSSFGEDGQGRVYVVSLAGPVYRLAPR